MSMTRISKTKAFMLTAGLHLLSVQQSFAQSVGHSGNIAFRGVVIFLVIVAGAYWLAGRYFKSRRRDDKAGGGLHFPPAVWFVITAITVAIGNVLLLQFMFSLSPHNDLLRGTVAIFYFLFGWVLPRTIVAFAQMMQT